MSRNKRTSKTFVLRINLKSGSDVRRFCEVHAGEGWPWYQRAYAVAVEPASTIPGHGMSTARAQGYPGVRFAAGQARQVVLEAVVFEADGAVADITEGGRVQLA